MADRPPPTLISYVIATAIISLATGYFLGQAKSIGLFSSSTSSPHTSRNGKASVDDSESDFEELEGDGPEDGDGEGEGEGAQELADFEDDGSECKLVLVVRTDLGMTKGKIAAQCGHATLACYKTLLHLSETSAAASKILKRWETYGQAKVAVQVKSEEELEVLQAQAVSLGICARIIHDAGRTQIASGSATVLGVGPAPKGKVDLVTGGLKLL